MNTINTAIKLLTEHHTSQTQEHVDARKGLQSLANVMARDDIPEHIAGLSADMMLMCMPVEYRQRLTLQHHACDQAQRIAELEAERDDLRARLAEMEQQEPICVVQMTTTVGRLRYNPDAVQLPEHGMPLYARPVPEIPADPGMLIAGMGSSSTQYVMGWNDCRATVLGPLRGDAVAIPDGWLPIGVTPATAHAAPDPVALLKSLGPKPWQTSPEAHAQARLICDFSEAFAAAPEAAR
jgi:hypothetical protein